MNFHCILKNYKIRHTDEKKEEMLLSINSLCFFVCDWYLAIEIVFRHADIIVQKRIIFIISNSFFFFRFLVSNICTTLLSKLLPRCTAWR